MNEQEVLFRLSELIEQHDLQDVGDESSSTQELLQKISRHLENAPSIKSPEKTVPGARAGDSAMVVSTKRTPYDVWKERNPDKLKEMYTPPALTEAQWNQLVHHLHETNKRKETHIMKKQNEGLAHELDGFNFQPKLNKISIELASNNKRLHQRLPAMLEKKEQHMKKQKEQQLSVELQECTFTPQLQGGKKAQEYLRRSRRPLKRTPDDYFNYAAEIKQRNMQRKQIIEDVESRELTFHPQLNRKSMVIQQRLRREGKIEIDPVTGQTNLHKLDSARNSENGDGEKLFQPQISERAQAYRPKDDGPVFDRLYRRAMDREQNRRLARTADFTAHFQNLPLKPWEMELNAILAFQEQSTKSYVRKGDSVRIAMLDNENRPITVVEHSEAVRSIWDSLVNSDPIRFNRDMY